MRLYPLFLFVSLIPCAAQPRLGAPALGFVYDPSLGAIRAIRGVPGAALLADVIETGLELTSAEISPSQDFALAVSASDRRVRLVRWPDGQAPSVTLVGGAMDSPDGLIFSPSGSAAVLQEGNSGRLQLITGLPESAVLQEIPSTASGAMTVSDNGAVALAGDDGVRIVNPDLISFVLPFPAGIRALAFSREGRDLAAITSSGDLYVARNIAAGVDIRNIPYGSPRLAEPVAIRFSVDGSSAYVADASGRLASIVFESGDITVISCQCAPTALQPLGRQGLLRATAISNQPLFLFDTSVDRPRVWFVPMADRRSAQ
jgi:hypothetical protein